jgi:hypothetical protein
LQQLPPFTIEAKLGVSEQFLRLGITDFHSAVEYVGYLPYGTNSDRADDRLVLVEGVGTCSTKHALLARLALEQGVTDIQLVVGIYEMNERNTPGVGTVLAQYDLDCLPEAHCYLMHGGKRYDVTSLGVSGEPIESFLLEEVISPDQIGAYKREIHRSALPGWIEEKGYAHHLDGEQLWAIREACIRALSAPEKDMVK